jgi:hypothetical protein
MIDRHSHAIVIGRVKAVRVTEGSAALLYWRGEYSEAGAQEPAAVRAWRHG